MSCALQVRATVEPRLGVLSPEMSIWRARPPSVSGSLFDRGGETLDLEEDLSDLASI